MILATGAQARWLSIPSEQSSAVWGFGLRDLRWLLFRGKEVLVVGGGNTAVEESLFLTNFATKVTVVHRRDGLRTEKMLQERVFKHPKIEVVGTSVVEDMADKAIP